jgi:hypothetical protein
MPSTPPVETPDFIIVSTVANLYLASIQKDISGMPPVRGAPLQGTQLEFTEDTHVRGANFSEEREREGGVGTFGLPGGGKGIVPLILLSPENAEDFCVGRI